MKSTIKLSVYRNEEITLTGETQELKSFIVHLACMCYEAAEDQKSKNLDGTANEYYKFASDIRTQIQKLDHELKDE